MAFLDRFGGSTSGLSPSSTPPPHQRSPVPRRGPYLQPTRPGLNPRSSSLVSLASSQSSVGPAHSARLPNGSSLKNQLANSPPDGPDPLQVLQNIIGAPPRKRRNSRYDLPHKPPVVAENVDFGGMSLQEFVEVEPHKPPQAPNIHTDSHQSVEEYAKEKDKFEELHKSILACDQILKSVETYLTNFQSDLGAVSAEIETLQSRSTALNTKLENRKVVEKLLGPSVEEISISPVIVKKIVDGPIDDGWVKALAELEKRKKAVDTKAKEMKNLKALEDVQPLLENLTDKAVERIRDYLVSQIKALRSPSINAQIIQQQGFIKYKDLYTFLARHQKQLAQDISQAYVNTMRWYYITHFTRYHASVQTMKLHVIDKSDVLAAPDSTAAKGGATNKVGTASHDAFSLGRRGEILRTSSTNALTSYVIEEDKGTHYLETEFRSYNLALVDNASFEYTFLTGFFSPAQSYQAVSRLFNSIFDPAFQLGQSLTKALVADTMDALGILIALRLNQQFAFELQRRKIPAMEGYVNLTNILLWPRFNQILDAHCDSLKRATAALSGRPPTTTASILSSSTSAAAANSIAPHPLTQRFAQFLSGILTLSADAGDDEPVGNSIARLEKEFDAWVLKLAKRLADPRKRQRFLFNNYSLVVTIIEPCEGRLSHDVRARFEALKEGVKS